jgi:hypothetical protein
MMAVNGCGFLLTDISGWDISACGHGFDEFGVCYELFSDNQEKILGGQSVVDVIFDAL